MKANRIILRYMYGEYHVAKGALFKYDYEDTTIKAHEVWYWHMRIPLMPDPL